MQSSRQLKLAHFRNASALKVRVFLLCLATLFATLATASHVHEPDNLSAYIDSQADHADHSSHSSGSLDNFGLLTDCDQFHTNSFAILTSTVSIKLPLSVTQKSQVAHFSVDSISPELLPPARAPPSGISLT